MRRAIVIVPQEARRVVRTTMVVSRRVRGSDRSRARAATRRSLGKRRMVARGWGACREVAL
eukprot:2420448-Rhodomonas_salina.2